MEDGPANAVIDAPAKAHSEETTQAEADFDCVRFPTSGISTVLRTAVIGTHGCLRKKKNSD